MFIDPEGIGFIDTAEAGISQRSRAPGNTAPFITARLRVRTVDILLTSRPRREPRHGNLLK
jgi:hypothetical protein